MLGISVVFETDCGRIDCVRYVKKESDDTKYFEYIAELAEGLGLRISLMDSLDEKRKPMRIFGTDEMPDDSVTVYEEQYLDRIDFGLFFDEVEEIDEDNE